MGMTERLKQLGWLKPGNVEKTIEAVEESKFQMRKDSDNLSVDQKYFMNLFEEKFPKVLDNVSLLGEQLYEIDKEIWHFKDLKSPKTYYPGIKNWENATQFGINFHPLRGWREDYLKFSFEKKSKELEEIAIKGEEISVPFKSFKAKTVNEFCKKYFELVEKNLNGNYTSRTQSSRFIVPADLIHLLNKIPEYIEIMYKGMENMSKMKKEESNSEVNSLEDLEVTDFVL